MLSGELAAGGGDVVASFDALGDVDAVGGEDSSEGPDGFGGGPGEAFAGVDPVEGDEVDDVRDAFDEAGEGAGLVGRVGDVADEQIFEGDFAASGGLVVAHGAHHFGDGPPVVNGHEAVADFVEGRVEREREVDREVEGGQFADLRHEANGADGHVAVAEADLVV